MDIVPLFRTLADETRIKVMALIIDRALSAEEIAAALDMPLKTVHPHLWRLEQSGLAERNRSSSISVYRFRRQPLLDALKAMAEPRESPDLPGDLEAYDQRVLTTFLSEDGRLKTIPAQQKKRDVILRFLAEKFDTGRMYGEKEVNEILARFHDDVASLRRYLVDGEFLQRQIVRVVEAGALLEGATPQVELRNMYWKPERRASSEETNSTEAS
jgi:hypothetical protein